MAGNKATTIALLVDGLKYCWPDFNITANEFINPTQDSVVKFYERFVKEYGIRTDAISTELIQQYQYDYKDHEEIMYLYMLYSCTNRLLDLISIQSLSLTFKDFVNPSDMVNRCSYQANYIYFVKNWKQSDINPINEKFREEANAVDNLSKEVATLNDQLKYSALTNARNIDKIEKLCDEKRELENIITQFKIELDKHKKEKPSLKHKLKLIEEENDKLTESLEKNVMRGKQLKFLIVDNHEAILAELDKLENDLVQEEIDSNIFLKTVQLKINTELFSTKNNKILNHFDDTSLLTKVLDTYHSIEEQVNEKEKINKELQITLETTEKVGNLNNQLNHMLLESEEKFQDLALQSNTVQQTLHSEITELNKEYEEINKKFEKSKCDEEKLNESLESIQNCCEEYKDKIQKQEEFYEKLLSMVLTKKQALDDKIHDTLTKIKEIVKKEKEK